MNTILILTSIILLFIAGVITMFAFKQEEKKMAKYKAEALTPEDARKRSQEYEEKSASSVIPLQLWTYLIVAVITVIIVVVFAMNY